MGAVGGWTRRDFRLLPVRLTHGPLAGRLWWLHLDGTLEMRIVAGRKDFRFTPISDEEW